MSYNTTMGDSADIWATPFSISCTNEAEVESRFIDPLLRVLGYAPEDIRRQQQIKIQTGRVTHSKRADYIVYDGPTHDKDTSLMVVEAKKPGEQFEPAIAQAESYAMAQAIRATVILVTDAVRAC